MASRNTEKKISSYSQRLSSHGYLTGEVRVPSRKAVIFLINPLFIFSPRPKLMINKNVRSCKSANYKEKLSFEVFDFNFTLSHQRFNRIINIIKRCEPLFPHVPPWHSSTIIKIQCMCLFLVWFLLYVMLHSHLGRLHTHTHTHPHIYIIFSLSHT